MRGLIWSTKIQGVLVVGALLVIVNGLGGASVASGATTTGTASASLAPVTVYVTNLGTNTVLPIDAATATPGTPIPVGHFPQGIAISPDGKTAYVANGSDDT